MSSWADKVPWGRLIQLTLFIVGGIACMALGQISTGTLLLGAAAGQVLPTNVVGTVKKRK